MTPQQMKNHAQHLMKELEKLPEEEKKNVALSKIKEIFGDHLPESLLELTSAFFFYGDSGASIDEKPSWLDLQKFRRGQKFYQDYTFANTYNELLSLFVLLPFDLGLNPMMFTEASNTPYKAFNRYLSTHFRFENWYTSDPWTCGTAAYNDIRYTRKIHNMVRTSLSNADPETYEKRLKLNPIWSVSAKDTNHDFQSVCPNAGPIQCPYTILGDFSNQTIQHASQAAMSVAQFGFCGLIVYKPQLFGIHNATDEDLDAFCHLWRGLGYLLGIDDDFNFCRGTLEDVRTRSKDILEYWVKPNFREIRPECEHMLRCVAESIQYYYPVTNFECCLLHLAEIMDVPMTRFFASLPYKVKFLHYISSFHFHFGSKIPGMQQLMNYTIKRAMLGAKKFDEERHKQLRDKSEKALDSSSWKLKSIEKSEELNAIQSLVLKLTALMVTVSCVIMLY